MPFWWVTRGLRFQRYDQVPGQFRNRNRPPPFSYNRLLGPVFRLELNTVSTVLRSLPFSRLNLGFSEITAFRTAWLGRTGYIRFLVDGNCVRATIGIVY